MKKKFIPLTALVLALALCCSCGVFNKDPRETTPNLLWLQPYGLLTTAVIYSSQASSQSWTEAYTHLSQSISANLTVEAIDLAEGSPDLSAYTLLYPDPSVLEDDGWRSLRDALVAYAKEGGALFLDNAFAPHFDLGFLGLSALSPLPVVAPREMTFPEVSVDLEPLQQIIRDASDLYNQYAHREHLDAMDYGVAFTPSTATPLAQWGDFSLFTLNTVGKGYVLLTSPLLPYRHSAAAYTLESIDALQDGFVSTTASLNQLFRSGFASYISREKYGFSMERVFGSYGRPGMSWQLPYDDLTHMEQDFAILFGDLAMEKLQIPSYSMARHGYHWNYRSETIAYVLGQEDAPFTFVNDPAESVPTIVDSRSPEPEQSDNISSLFADNRDYAQSAYPTVIDLDGDGILDLLAGSSDGFIYFFQGMESDEPLTVAERTTLRGLRVNALRTTGASAPSAAYIDQDAHLDIVSGTDDGTIVWYSGTDTMEFIPRDVLLDTGLGRCQTFPHMADVNGDGALDLLVGTDTGRLFLYYGIRSMGGVGYNTLTPIDLTDTVSELGQRIVPRFFDWNGEGQLRIAVGTADGYIAILNQGDSNWEHTGYLMGETINENGNTRLKFGNNCAPFFGDINNDSITDLIVGTLEYTAAYPIDAPLFPAMDQLEEQVKYMKSHYFYVGTRTFLHPYADQEQLARELDLHKEAFAFYGLPFDPLGINQSMEYTGQVQGYRNQYAGGILWNSSFSPESSAAEGALRLPFYLVDRGERTILLHSPTALTAETQDFLSFAARYHMPLSLSYRHDMTAEADSLAYAIEQAGAHQDTYNYNFVREDQLLKSIHAAYNTHVTAWLPSDETEDGSIIQQPWEEVGYPETIFDQYTLVLVPNTVSEDGGLYDEDFQQAVGIKLTLAERNSAANVQTNADVWLREGNDIYLALNKDVQVYVDDTQPAASHLARINLPANITRKKSTATIAFTQDGMMQVLVQGPSTLVGEGWIVTQKDGYTQYTRFGKAATLELSFEGK